MTPATAFKVLTAEQMAALEADGSFAGAPVDLADGYVHLSTFDQLTETVDKHFAGQDDLHVAEVDLGGVAGRAAIPAPLCAAATQRGSGVWAAAPG